MRRPGSSGHLRCSPGLEMTDMTGTEGETSGGGRAGSGMAEARRVICLNVARREDQIRRARS